MSPPDRPSESTPGAAAALRVALVQMTVTDGDPAANLARAESLIGRAPAADLYVLPELCTTGYAHDAWWPAAVHDTPRTLAALQALADARGAWVVAGTIAHDGEALVNRLHLLSPRGAVDAIAYDKAHLIPAMGEPERLRAGRRRVAARIGDGARATDAALSLCFDLRFPEQYRRDAADGATLFVCASEWPHPRAETLRLLARARAAENQAWLALSNRVGPAADGTVFCGGSCLVSPDGVVLADAGDAHDVVVLAAVDASVALRARATFPVLPFRAEGVDW